MQSRRDDNLAGRFPEIAAAGRRLGDVVLDGELVTLREGKLDFGSLTSSPGKRAEIGDHDLLHRLDLLAEGERGWRPEPYDQRRRRLEELFDAWRHRRVNVRLATTGISRDPKATT